MNQDLQASPPFRVIPVLDIRGGQAVHARGGDRGSYQGVVSLICDGDDPAELAHAFRDRLGLDSLYVADLGAIGHGRPDEETIRGLSGLGLEVWLDAGVRDNSGLEVLIDSGVSSVILATETLPGPSLLVETVEQYGPKRLVFGLDLKDGLPVLARSSRWDTTDPLRLIGSAIEAGIRRVLLLDLSRVGSSQGFGTLSLLRSILTRFGPLDVAVGGGVGSLADVRAARDYGASAVLVGSALHDGRLSALDIHRLHSATAD